MISGILPVLAVSLKRRGPVALLTAKLVAELAKECKLISVMLKSFFFFFVSSCSFSVK